VLGPWRGGHPASHRVVADSDSTRSRDPRL